MDRAIAAGLFDTPDTGQLEPEAAAFLAGTAPPSPRVEERRIPGGDADDTIRVRVTTAGDGPVLVWAHGGGFVTGGIESHDAVLHALAVRAACCVVAVEYRLAPLFPYPAAIADTVAALRWAARLGRPLAIGGDSAGGNLATVAALRSRGAAHAPALQLLVYPDADARPGSNTPSWRAHDGLVLDRATKDRTLDLYLPGATDRASPEISPALAPPGALAGLPPALVVTAEFDPQRDEGETYARRLLRENNVPVALERVPGMIHGFWQMGFGASAALTDRLARALRGAAPENPAREGAPWTPGPGLGTSPRRA